MTGPEHYQRAEQLLMLADGQIPEQAAYTVAKAQVHATLAQAGQSTRPALAHDTDVLTAAFGAGSTTNDIRVKYQNATRDYRAEAWHGLTCMTATAATPHEALTEATDLLATHLADGRK